MKSLEKAILRCSTRMEKATHWPMGKSAVGRDLKGVIKVSNAKVSS